MKPKKEKIVIVEWVDSASVASWQPEDECKFKLMHCKTVGFLVDETKEGISIALSKAMPKDFNPYGQLMSIPKCAIKKIKRVSL